MALKVLRLSDLLILRCGNREGFFVLSQIPFASSLTTTTNLKCVNGLSDIFDFNSKTSARLKVIVSNSLVIPLP